MENVNGDPNKLREELLVTKEALQRAEADAEVRALAAREQLRAAKERAKALFLSKVNVLEGKISELEETSKARESENEQLKLMLRDSDKRAAELSAVQATLSAVEHERNVARSAVDAQNVEVERLKDDLDREKMENEDLRAKESVVAKRVAELEEELRVAVASFSSTGTSAADGRVDNAPHPSRPDEAKDVSEKDDRPTADRTGDAQLAQDFANLKIEFEAAQLRIREFESGNVNTRGDVPRPILLPGNEVTGIVSESSVKSPISSDPRLTDALGLVEDLTSRELEARTKLDSAQARLDTLEKENEELESALAELRMRQSNEKAVTPSPQAPSTADGSRPTTLGSGEDVQSLLAKVAGLELQLNSKQIEIGKVRDKARAYLKDLNAEKRDVEARMRDEMKTLAKNLEEEKSKLVSAGQNNENILRELDECMSIIGEKQKAINALSMTVTNERAAVREAQRQSADIQNEFERYKERACKALEERDFALKQASFGVENATKELRAQIASLEADLESKQQQLKSLKAEADTSNRWQARAQEAESALELNKQDSTTSKNVDLTRMYSLEADLDCMRRDMESSRATVAELNSKYLTALGRLEVSEERLKAAELRGEEAASVAARKIKELLTKIDVLETALRKAHETAVAAQRTAAVAARVMSQHSDPTRFSRNGECSPANRDDALLSPTATEPPSPAPYNPGSDARDWSRPDGTPGTDFLQERDRSDIESRDQQIAVLMSQIAELSTLLGYAQNESEIREEQTTLLKAELRDLQSKLSAAEKLQNGTPFSYMRTIVARYLETGDPTLLPVVCDLLSFSDEESRRVRAARGGISKAGPNQGSYFSKMPFLGGS